jgi:hypothetical protein
MMTVTAATGLLADGRTYSSVTDASIDRATIAARCFAVCALLRVFSHATGQHGCNVRCTLLYQLLRFLALLPWIYLATIMPYAVLISCRFGWRVASISALPSSFSELPDRQNFTNDTRPVRGQGSCRFAPNERTY